MPFVTITLIEGHSEKEKREIISGCAEVVAKALQLPKDHIWVRFDEFSEDNAGRGGVPYSDISKIEIKVEKGKKQSSKKVENEGSNGSRTPWKTS